MPQPNLSYAAASILFAIGNGYQYGFDVMDFTGLPSGTVYPALRRLEEAGFVSSQWEKEVEARQDQRPARKYYTVSETGGSVLEAALERYPLLSRAAVDLQQKQRK